MKGTKNVVYLGLALAMLIYALPLLKIGQGMTAEAIFGIVWIGIVMLVISAHLHQLLGVDEETQRQLARVRKYKRWRLQQMFLGKSKAKLKI